MRGRAPKSPALLQRRNRVAGRATLPSEAEAKNATVPVLPKRGRGTGKWHARVKAWWVSVWTSPMAAEYVGADARRIELVAELHQKFWAAADRGESVTKLAAEIRQQEALLGLSPMDRRRLQWEIEKGEQAEDRTTKRRAAKQPSSKKDPRDVLKLA